MKYRIGIIVGGMLLVSVITILMFMSGQQRSKLIENMNIPIIENTMNSRFEEVERIIFCKDRYGDIPATIYRDKETDVKYLYVWFGMANGGPVLTRLWDK